MQQLKLWEARVPIVNDANGVNVTILSLTLLFLFTLCSSHTLAADIDNGSGVTPSTISITDVTDRTHISYIVSHFQHQLSRLHFDSSIIACDHVVELREASVGRDYSYGANCTVGNGSQQLSVLMCNDNLVGKFTLGESGSRTREGIGRFIQNNCPPGG